MIPSALKNAGPLGPTNGHLPAAHPFPDVHGSLSSTDDYIQVIYAGAGGTGTRVGAVLARMTDELGQASMRFDTDIKVLKDTGPNRLAFHLSGRGSFGRIIENRDRYSLIANGGLPESTRAWHVNEGVGMVRLGTTILTAYNLDQLKVFLHQSIEDALVRLQGPMDKRIVFHYGLCPGGGSGSGLAMALAALTLDAVRTISPTLQVANVVHCVSPSAFLRSLRTPGERQRLMANSAKFFKEVKFALRPGNFAGYERALGIAPLNRPPIDQLVYYGNTDAANSIQLRERIHERIAVNVLASRNQELQALETSRGVNPATILDGSGRDEAGTAVVSTETTVIARACTPKLAAAAAGREQSRQLSRQLAAETDGAAVEAAVRSLSPALQLEQFSQAVRGTFRQNSHRFQMPVLDRVGAADALALCEKAGTEAVERLRLDLEQKGEQLGQELPAKVAAVARKFAKACVDNAGTLSRYQAVLAAAAAHLDQKITATEDRLERVPAEAARKRFELARARLEAGTHFPWKRKQLRARARGAFQEVINGEVQQASDRVYHELVLTPLAAGIKAAIENSTRLKQSLHTVRSQLTAQQTALESELGYQNSFYTEVIQQSEVPGVLQRVAAELPAKLGAHPALPLEKLLAASGSGDLAQVFEEHGRVVRARVGEYFQQTCENLTGLCRHFGLAFDLKRFLAANATMVLPSRLDLAAHGPAHVPLQAYIVTPDSLAADALAVVAGATSQEFEWVAGSNPFEVILRARMTKAPFSTLPDRGEMLRSYEEFKASAPGDTVYGMLGSHPTLDGSDDVSL